MPMHDLAIDIEDLFPYSFQPARNIHYNDFVWKTLPFCFRNSMLG